MDNKLTFVLISFWRKTRKLLVRQGLIISGVIRS
jgi:hypothetical protein